MELDNRGQITLDDLQKCMESVVNKYTKKRIRSLIVYQVHPGHKTTMVKFEYNGKTKNVKLLSDVAIVLKY